MRLVDNSKANKNSIEDAIEVVAPNGFRVLIPGNASAKSLAAVVIGAKPAQVIERGVVEAGMLAYIATSKYADRLPLHRLESIFKRQGATISRSTMCDWLIAAGRNLSGLHELMVKRVLNSRVIWTDDTPVQMQDRELEKKLRRRGCGHTWVMKAIPM